ncbi:MAG: SBBP repeat-containing protein [Acidimicrobiales bacterium]
MRRAGAWGAVLAVGVLGLGAGALPGAEVARGPDRPGPGEAVRLIRDYGRLPLGFAANTGQADAGVDFVARGRGYSLALAAAEARMALAHPPHDGGAATASVVSMRLVGGDPAAGAVANDRLPGSTNLIVGGDPRAWRTGIPSYAAVRYRGVYPGVDVVYHGDQGELEYDFVIAPGADPGVVALAFHGVDGVSLDGRGELVLSVPGGEVRQRRPVIYQEVNGRRRPVRGGYVVGADQQVGFRVGPYDTRLPLVIDPVLTYATYLGGSDDDEGRGITVDAAGNAWITGITPSSPTFPTVGALQPEGDNVGAGDAFVAKLRPDGSALEFSTYLGGSGFDAGIGIDTDASGAAFVVGATDSTDFPTVNPFQAANGGGRDAFVAKLDPSGSSLVYSTYLGGSGREAVDRFGALVAGIAVGSTGRAHVTGATGSGDFPVVGAIQPAKAGLGDAFVAKLGIDGNAMGFATYLGGSDEDAATAIAVDGAGAIYVAGFTASSDLPATPGALSTAAPGGTDGFLAKLEANGSALAYATYLGGTGFDAAAGIAVDDDGAAYLAGRTASTDFPVAPAAGALQAAYGGRTDAFVAKLSPPGSALEYATYLGGSDSDTANGIALWSDPSGATHAVVTGDTRSADFPLASPVQDHYGGAGHPSVPGGDAFVSELTAAGTALAHSTYLGGTSGDSATGVGVDAAGNAYVTGMTASADFPVIAAVQTAPAGGRAGFDAFVAKLARSDPSLPTVTGLAPQSGPASIETEVVITGSGISGATAVFFGERPAGSLRVVSPTRLAVVAPAQAEGAVDVRVTTQAGTSAPTPFGRFTYAEGSWRPVPAPPAGPRVNHSATRLADGTVLIAGGCLAVSAEGCTADSVSASAELFDPVSESWRATSPMPGGRYGHTATALGDGRVLVAGGIAGASMVETLLYEPGTGGWRRVGPLSTARAFHTATLLDDGAVLVVGGQGGGDRLASAERFDPSAETWSVTAPPASPHSRHTATLLANGTVLVVGGDRDPQSCDGCPPPPELFDPGANAWSPAAPQIMRFGHTATLLSGPAASCGTRCGQVLVAGGFTDTNAFRLTASADLFDPASSPAGRWAPTRPLPTARGAHTATRLPGGKVLLVGGTAGRSAPLYHPADGRWGSAGYAMSHRSGTVSAAHTATLLDGGACGASCGKVLVVGAGTAPVAELYTPRPAVTILTPNHGPGTGGTSVVLTGTGFANRVRAVTFGGRPAAFTVDSPTRLTAVSPPGIVGTVDVVVVTEGGVSAPSPFTVTDTGAVAPPTTGPISSSDSGGDGYRLVASDGGVFAFGGASFLGSTGALRLNQPVVGMAGTPSGAGYWLVARDGGVFSFGDARFFGSTGGLRLNQPVVGMAATATGEGYWLVGADGGVFAFGDARFFGSTGGIQLARPVVGIASSPSGGGYRIVASDGGVFAFGDARFLGSTGGLRLSQPVVGVATTPSGSGYWLVGADGGVFAFGDAPFVGSTGAMRLNRPIVGMAARSAGGGYWLVASDGGIFAFGDAPFFGSTGALELARPMVGMGGTQRPPS